MSKLGAFSASSLKAFMESALSARGGGIGALFVFKETYPFYAAGACVIPASGPQSEIGLYIDDPPPRPIYTEVKAGFSAVVDGYSIPFLGKGSSSSYTGIPATCGTINAKPGSLITLLDFVSTSNPTHGVSGIAGKEILIYNAVGELRYTFTIPKSTCGTTYSYCTYDPALVRRFTQGYK